MKKMLLALAALGALPLAAAADVTKDDIKKLAAAGISDDVIMTFIRTHGPVARLSADDMVELKQAGVSEKVLGSLAGGTAAARTEVVEKQVVVPTTTYVPSTTYVYSAPAYSYSYDSYWPYYYSSAYYYPRYYSSCTPYYYSSCYPRYSATYYGGYRSCHPRAGFSVGVRW